MKTGDVYRAEAVARGVPLGARSAGHYRFAPGRQSSRSRIHFAQILWSVRGTGCAHGDGGDHLLPPGHAFVFLPPMEHFYRAEQEPWELRYFTLDGLCAAETVEGFGFPAGRPFYVGSCPAALFRDLERQLGDGGDPIRASVAAYRLLAEMARRHRRTPALSEQESFLEAAFRLIRDRLSDPGVGVEQLAAAMGETRFSFTRKFHAGAGVSPGDYLRTARTQRGVALLSAPETTLDDAARRCGFSNARAFSRFFVRQVGVSPTAFQAKRRSTVKR